jgi:hypothetical protein|tara:strand:+ start:454 stop:786 length:333 start_codon:yes stop_codon:yes gene_type:complete
MQSKVKQHLSKASNMSFTDIIKGTTRLTGNAVSLGFKTIGATVYIADKAINAGLQVGKAAYNESKKGYHQTDDLLSSSNQEQPQRSYPVGSDAVKRKDNQQPQQMEFDFE